MLKLLRSIVQKLSTITQLREEVVELRKQMEDYEFHRDSTTYVYTDAIQTIKDLATIAQNQSQLIYQLKFRLENVEKNIKTDSDRIIAKMACETGTGHSTDDRPNDAKYITNYTKKEED